MTMLRKVLLATDGSPGAQAAARWVAALGAAQPALHVTLVHVLPAFPLATTTSAMIDRQALEAMGEPAVAAARTALGDLREVDSRVVLGPAGERITALAAEEGYDLIAVGRRGLNPLQQVLLGSVSGRVLQLARCPVVVVQGEQSASKEATPMLRKVLLAVDGSPSSLAATRWVADLAERLPGLRVTAVHVVQDPRAYVGIMAEGYAPVPPMDRKTLEALGQPALDAARAVIGDRVPFETRVLIGSAPEAIVAFADEGGFDLIAMGRRGLNPITQLVLGSVSERVVHIAPCPVLIVRT
jgi:nucleotide-binding universal stress UspA family protein